MRRYLHNVTADMWIHIVSLAANIWTSHKYLVANCVSNSTVITRTDDNTSVFQSNMMRKIVFKVISLKGSRLVGITSS